MTLHRALPVSLRVPYSVGGTTSSADYADLSPAPEEGLLFPAGETRRQIALTLLAGADKLGKTLVLTLGELSEIDLLRADGTGPKAPFLKAESPAVPFSRWSRSHPDRRQSRPRHHHGWDLRPHAPGEGQSCLRPPGDQPAGRSPRGNWPP